MAGTDADAQVGELWLPVDSMVLRQPFMAAGSSLAVRRRRGPEGWFHCRQRASTCDMGGLSVSYTMVERKWARSTNRFVHDVVGSAGGKRERPIAGRRPLLSMLVLNPKTALRAWARRIGKVHEADVCASFDSLLPGFPNPPHTGVPQRGAGAGSLGALRVSQSLRAVRVWAAEWRLEYSTPLQTLRQGR